jgi:type I restriction enzyme S subunit
MVKRKNIPALRFTGFEEEWIEKQLSEIVEVKSEKYNPEKETNIIKCLELEHLAADGAGELLGYIDGSCSGSIKNRFKKNDILFGKLRPYLKKYLKAPFDGVCSSEIWVLKGKTISNDYLYCLVQTNNFIDLVNISSGSKMPRADWSVVANGNFFIPSLPEQQKIASFLTAVDERIQQLTRKKKLLEQYKKGVMQKIFSREIRFKDDKGKNFPDWEVKFAKDIFKNHTNKNHNGDLPILAATQDKGVVYRDSIDIKIQSSQESINTYKIVEIGDFVISLRSFQGGIEYSKVYGICSPAYTVLKPKIEISNEFFRYYFKRESFIQQLSSTVIGIRDGKQISYEPFSGLKLLFPTVKEQEKIGSFITAFENKIELVNTQLQKTQAWKNGLLQKMFV